MKHLMLLTIFLIVFISLCEYLPEINLSDMTTLDQEQKADTITLEKSTPDLFLSIEIIPSEVKSDREIQLLIEIKNKQTYDLSNIVFKSYDHLCFPTGEFEKNIGTIKGNRTKMWSWKWRSDTFNMDRECIIGFSLEYTADYSYFQDVVVLPEVEYHQRELEGTLKDIPIQSSSKESALGLSIDFSENQPLLENEEQYYMYINYYNRGKGFFDDLDIKLTPPNNIENLDCRDYSSAYQLEDDLVFIRGRASPTACNFTTKETSAINVRSLSLTANYKYILYNSISITVKA